MPSSTMAGLRHIWYFCQSVYRRIVPWQSPRVYNRGCQQGLLDTLPPELLAQVYGYLQAPRDIVRLSLLNRSFRSEFLRDALFTVQQHATTSDEVSYLTVKELANRKHIVCSIWKVLHQRLRAYECSAMVSWYCWPTRRECSDAAGYLRIGCSDYKFGKEAVDLMLRARHVGKAYGMPLTSIEHSCEKVCYKKTKAEGEYIPLTLFLDHYKL